MRNIFEENMGKILLGIGALCFVVLSVAEYRGLFGRHVGVWSVSFDEPMTESLVFKVENKSPSVEFEYAIFEEKKPIGEGFLTVPSEGRGQVDTRTVIRSDAFPLEGKIRIRVKDAVGGEKYIFKIVESVK